MTEDHGVRGSTPRGPIMQSLDFVEKVFLFSPEDTCSLSFADW